MTEVYFPYSKWGLDQKMRFFICHSLRSWTQYVNILNTHLFKNNSVLYIWFFLIIFYLKALKSSTVCTRKFMAVVLDIVGKKIIE